MKQAPEVPDENTDRNPSERAPAVCKQQSETSQSPARKRVKDTRREVLILRAGASPDAVFYSNCCSEGVTSQTC